MLLWKKGLNDFLKCYNFVSAILNVIDWMASKYENTSALRSLQLPSSHSAHVRSIVPILGKCSANSTSWQFMCNPSYMRKRFLIWRFTFILRITIRNELHFIRRYLKNFLKNLSDLFEFIYEKFIYGLHWYVPLQNLVPNFFFIFQKNFKILFLTRIKPIYNQQIEQIGYIYWHITRQFN